MFVKCSLVFALIAIIISAANSASTGGHQAGDQSTSGNSGQNNGGDAGDGMTSFQRLANSLMSTDRSRSGGNVSVTNSGGHNGAAEGGIGLSTGANGSKQSGLDTTSASENDTAAFADWLNSNASEELAEDVTTTGYNSATGSMPGTIQNYLDRLNSLATSVQSQLNRGITLLSRVGNQAPNKIPQAAATLQQYLHQLNNNVAGLQARINEAASMLSRYSSQSPLTGASNQMQDLISQLRGFVAQG